jgi:hypothetical protein
MTDLDLPELKRLEAAATPGAWTVIERPYKYAVETSPNIDSTERRIGTVEFHPQSKSSVPVVWPVARRASEDWAKHGVHISASDAAFIAALRNAATALIAAAEERDARRHGMSELRNALTAANARIGELTKQRNELADSEARYAALAIKDGQLARIGELEAALKPFANLRCMTEASDEGEAWDTPDMPDSVGFEITLATTADGACDLTLGQFRRARAVLASKPGADAKEQK